MDRLTLAVGTQSFPADITPSRPLECIITLSVQCRDQCFEHSTAQHSTAQHSTAQNVIFEGVKQN